MTVALLQLFSVCGTHLLICCTWSASLVVANEYSLQLLASGRPSVQWFPLGLHLALTLCALMAWSSGSSYVRVALEPLSPKVQYIPHSPLPRWKTYWDQESLVFVFLADITAVIQGGLDLIISWWAFHKTYLEVRQRTAVLSPRDCMAMNLVQV